MAYWWKPDSGAFSTESLESAGLLPRFEDQAKAEEWLSLFYGSLLEGGVGDVCLFEEDRLVYGPMSLDS